MKVLYLFIASKLGCFSQEEVYLPIKVSTLSGFFGAQEITVDEKNEPDTQRVILHY